MMKITGLSHLFKWENLHNWWLTKNFFAPLYIYIYIHTVSHRSEYTPHIFVNTLLYILYFIIYIHSSDQSHIPNKSLV